MDFLAWRTCFVIVCKFGGSSTTNLIALKNIKKISKNKERKILVFSAFGKPFFSNKKLTDVLLEKDIKKTKMYFEYLCQITNTNFNVGQYIDNIYNIYSKNNNIDYLVSRGEFFTCLVMSKYLNIKFVPAEKIIYFDKKEINYKKISQKIKYYLKKYDQIIIPGFYGVDEFNNIKLFSRGGGDITGGILAKCVGANLYENYTDTSGIKMVNPLILESSKTITNISFLDALVMTSCDANILHNNVCKILQDTNTKVEIKNIYNLNSQKTVIDNQNHKCQFVCFKQVGDYIQIVAKTNSVDKLKKYYDQINYINSKYVYFCSDVCGYKQLIKGIYKAIEN